MHLHAFDCERLRGGSLKVVKVVAQLGCPGPSKVLTRLPTRKIPPNAHSVMVLWFVVRGRPCASASASLPSEEGPVPECFCLVFDHSWVEGLALTRMRSGG